MRRMRGRLLPYDIQRPRCMGFELRDFLERVTLLPVRRDVHFVVCTPLYRAIEGWGRLFRELR